MRPKEQRDKRSKSRKRDIESDPIYPSQNYNKKFRFGRTTPFTWNKRCNLSHRVDRMKYAMVEIEEGLKNYSR